MKRSAFRVLYLFVFLLFLITPFQSIAQQQPEENLLEALEDLFKQDYLSIGVLLQSQGEFHYNPDLPGQNTFRVPTARLKVSGELDNNFGYVLQADVTRNPSLLDANISFSFSDEFSLSTGAMKPGISAEYLRPASALDFINRSRIVSILAQNRDIGVLAQAELTPGLVVSGGIFNGRNQNLSNNDNEFYYTGRIEAGSEIGPDATLQIGGNIGHSRENGTQIGNGSLPLINGYRTIYGGDIRLEYNRFLVSGEFLGGNLEYAPSSEDEILGFHITGGVWATKKLQFLVRLDHVESSELSASQFPEPVDLVLGGITYKFTDAARFQLNYQVNPEELDINNQILLAEMQIAF